MPTRPRVLPFLAATLLAGGVVLASAPAASAHAQFLGSDPEEGSTVDALPAVVVMTYDEDISPQFVDTAVIPPGGEPVVVEATVDGVDVSVPVADDPALADLVDDPAAAGEWQVVARVVSVDGHPVEHTSDFVLPESAIAAAPAPKPSPGSSDAASEAPAAPVETPDPSAVEVEATAAPTEEPQVEPTDDTASTAVTEATEPLAGTEEGLPRWAAALTGVAIIGAAATAGVLAWRRRSAGGGPTGT
ncbi:copper resistance CopC family protein [Aquipuribacter sp. SD81]|uniref:copper resistance CopC family protein n=1 Tax=Aquipuribacter sp. SD81 TaxID=3127703 RepID=UPI003015A225